MKLSKYLLLIIFLLPVRAFCQDDLFGSQPKKTRSGFIIAVSGNFDMPGADMAKRFGLSYRLGPSVLYKTKENWIFGIKADFIFGNQIKEDSFMSNLGGLNGTTIGFNGIRTGADYFERGYLIGLQAGRIFPISPKTSDNGLLLLTSAGFIQHKILISTKNSGDIPQLAGDYKKGYDRLTNGWFLEQFAGYNYFAKDGLINFNIGLDITAGFTKGRRDYLLDVRKAGNDSRVDLLFGVKGTWYIPIFRRKSEDYFFQ